METRYEFFLHDNPKCEITAGLREVDEDGAGPLCEKPLIFLENLKPIPGPKTKQQLGRIWTRLVKRYGREDF